MKRILLLEDDVNFNETIAEFLEDNGFEVDSFYEGQGAEEAIYEKQYDLLLLDVNVPSPNGFELLQSSRERGETTPAIYITSLNSTQDLEQGFKSGCDDYLRKPFELRELLIRVNNIIQRSFYHNPDEHINIDEHLVYDVKGDELLLDGKVVSFHLKEKALLKLFLQHRNEQISHEVINEHLWSFDEEASDAALRTYIKNLRKVIGKDRIVSIKRYGYKFA